MICVSWLSWITMLVLVNAILSRGNEDNKKCDRLRQEADEHQSTMEKLIGKLDRESWSKEPKKLMEELAQQECPRLNNEEEKENELVREIKETVKQRYCKKNERENMAMVKRKNAEIVAKLSAIFREDGPKSVEKLREAEESDQKLLEDPRFVRVYGWLRTVEAKMEPGADKDAVGRVLRKRRVKPSDMMGLGLELWAMATTPSCAQPQVAQQQQPLRVHRRRRRMDYRRMDRTHMDGHQMDYDDWERPGRRMDHRRMDYDEWERRPPSPPRQPQGTQWWEYVLPDQLTEQISDEDWQELVRHWTNPRHIQRRMVLFVLAVMVAFLISSLLTAGLTVLNQALRIQWVVFGLGLALFHYFEKHRPAPIDHYTS